TRGTPETLDRISLDAIYDTIKNRSNSPKINKDKIMLLGTSRGGELVLNLASMYKEFDAVVALVPAHMRFPAASITSNTSAWTYNEKELSYLPVPFSAIITSLAGKKELA